MPMRNGKMYDLCPYKPAELRKKLAEMYPNEPKAHWKNMEKGQLYAIWYNSGKKKVKIKIAVLARYERNAKRYIYEHKNDGNEYRHVMHKEQVCGMVFNDYIVVDDFGDYTKYTRWLFLDKETELFNLIKMRLIK